MDDKVKIGFVSTYPPVVSGLSRYADELCDFMNSSFDDVCADKLSINESKRYKKADQADFSEYDIMVYNIGNHPMNQRAFDYALKNPSLVVLHEFDISSLNVKPLFMSMMKMDPLSALVHSGNAFVVHSDYAKERIEERGALVFKVNEFYFSRRGRDSKIGKESVGVFGYIAKSKGAFEILDAYKKYADRGGTLKLFFAGNSADIDIETEINKRNLQSMISFYENPPDEQYDSMMENCIGAINLRTKHSGETSANMLKLFSLEKRTAVNDLMNADENLSGCFYKIDSKDYQASLLKFFNDIEKNKGDEDEISAECMKKMKESHSIERVSEIWHQLFLRKNELKKYIAEAKKKKARNSVKRLCVFLGRCK